MTRTVPRGEARERLLEATWNLIAVEGAAAVTLARVAGDVGVSRQSIYLFFGSRAGLLVEALRRHDERSGIGRRLLRAACRHPAPAGLRAVVGVWFAYLPEIDPVAEAMEAAAVTDPDAAEAWASRMAAIRGVLAAVLRRLEAEGDLAAGWNAERAADFAFALSQIGTWRALARRGWGEAEAARAVCDALDGTLLRRTPG